MRTRLKSGVVVDTAQVMGLGWMKQDALYRVFVTLNGWQDIMAGDFDTLAAAEAYRAELYAKIP